MYLKFIKGEIPRLPRDVDWRPRARAWWRTWTESQQTEIMTDVDWQIMLVTALLVHQFWCNGHWTVAAEIRLREAKMGATLGAKLVRRHPGGDRERSTRSCPRRWPPPRSTGCCTTPTSC
jgi:hypothetical protein